MPDGVHGHRRRDSLRAALLLGAPALARGRLIDRNASSSSTRALLNGTSLRVAPMRISEARRVARRFACAGVDASSLHVVVFIRVHRWRRVANESRANKRIIPVTLASR